MEQVITIHIIDKPQYRDGREFDVAADFSTNELTVSDVQGDTALDECILSGIHALRGRRMTNPRTANEKNVTLIDPQDVPICPMRNFF